MEILITVGLLVISGVGTYFYMQSNEEFDVISDYKEIKAAFKTFRNENIGLTKGINNIKKYMSKDSKVNLSNYEMSIDDKFLIVKKVPKGVNPKDIAKQIGGSSVFKDNKLKLSFFTRPSGTEPIAEITVKPVGNVTTTTRMEFSSEKSTVEENTILKEEWVNNEEYFDTDGVQVVKLRVMDKNFKWSEWTSIEIFVSEEKGVKSISGSGMHMMMLMNNGTVFAYGENSFGQLGNCTNQNNTQLEEIVQIDKVLDVAMGDNHTLFLKADKRVFGTGNNDFGQLGSGNRTASKIPKLTWGIENIVDISAGVGFSAAVTMDGRVYTWGRNENNCLGQGESHYIDRPSRMENLDNIQSIACGYDFAMALGYDGNVYSWGNNNHGQLALGYKSKFDDVSTSILKDIKQVAAGRNFSLALTNQGRVMGCGLNSNQQMGYDGEKEVLFPKEIIGLKDIEKICCSNDFSLVLDKMGNMYTWGQYSPVDYDYATTPFLCDSLKYVKDIAVTDTHGYALTEEGEVYKFSTKFQNMYKLEVTYNES